MEKPTFLEQQLCSVDPALWQLDHDYILDWYDGQLEGVCELSYPSCCFHYKIAAHSGYLEESSRLYRVSELPLGSAKQIESWSNSILKEGEPWVSIWHTPLGADLKKLLDSAQQTQILILTDDMKKFQGVYIPWRF